MPRFVALLRGVSPVNASMPELKRAFEAAGFGNVKTVLGTGNLTFDARQANEAALQRRAEAAMQATLGRSFQTFVRSSDALRTLLQTDPYAPFGVPPQAKRVVTFLHAAGTSKLALPLWADEAGVCCLIGREAFSAYLPGDKGPVFMKLLEKCFGAAITTRTWDTVRKCAAA